jgi:hypothetical protein
MSRTYENTIRSAVIQQFLPLNTIGMAVPFPNFSFSSPPNCQCISCRTSFSHYPHAAYLPQTTNCSGHSNTDQTLKVRVNVISQCGKCSKHMLVDISKMICDPPINNLPNKFKVNDPHGSNNQEGNEVQKTPIIDTLAPVKEKNQVEFSDTYLPPIGTILFESTKNKNSIERLLKFKNLFTLMKKFLLNVAIAFEDVNLSEIEKQLFGCFLVKKYKANKNIVSELLKKGRIDYELVNLPDLCNKINEMPSEKRKEENFKLIFNWAFDFLIEKIQTENKLKRNEAENFFYTLYFKEISVLLKIDLKKFHRPSFSRSSIEIAKTYNTKYLKLIMQSKLFKNNFAEVMRSNFFSSFTELIEEKIFTSCKKWENLLKVDQFSTKSLNKLCEFIIRNKKVKTPWSIKDAQYAKVVVLKELRNL